MTSFNREGMATGAYLIPMMQPLKFNCFRYGEERGKVARALPFVIADKCSGATVQCRRDNVITPAPANDQGFEPVLNFRPRIQKRSALGGQKPFVAGAGINVTTQLVQIQRKLAGHVRAINDGEDTALTCQLSDLLHRKN